MTLYSKWLFIHIVMLTLFLGLYAQIGNAKSVSNGSVATGKAAKNSLYQHASPYLDMHGRDPVRWQEWNAKTLQQAKKQNKLIFVSSGYFSCHWCHVMQRESYQNNEVAKLLNDFFIPVKVDRELDSALDALLIDFTERTQGHAGWPLNVFVTPDGYPLVGMTYVPTDNFLKVLKILNDQWLKKPGELRDMAQAASSELSVAEVSDSSNISKLWVNELKKIYVYQSLSSSDDMQGGFGEQNKFPNVPKLTALLELYVWNESKEQSTDKSKNQVNQKLKTFLTLSLDKMASQGLWDQLGGGFYRYAVDPGWQVPHFEKMLYDNALLASLYYRAADVFANERYRKLADATITFMLNDLTTASPAFAASLSAVDNHGIEGGYYLWTNEVLKQTLSAEEYKLINLYWGLSGAVDLDDGHHFAEVMSVAALAKELKISETYAKAQLQSVRKKLLKVRAQRVLPKDEKILTAWNALSLSALIAGARQNKQHKQAAEELVEFFRSKLWDAKQKELHRAYSDRASLGGGTLEDYAYTAQALLAWWQLEKKAEDKKWLEEIINQAWQRFYSEQGWVLAENMLLKYGSGQTIVSDGPLPSPSSVLIETTYRFAELTDNDKWKEKALRALNVGHQDMREQAFYYASQLAALLKVESLN